MKRRFTQGLLILTLLCGAVLLGPTVAWAAPAGDGSLASPYQIADADDLYWFAEQVNGGDVDACAVLMGDIDLNGNESYQWSPIGRDQDNTYTGTFNGNNKTISGLYIDSDAQNIGLFGYIGEGGAVQDLTLADSYINSSNSSDQSIGSVGGICGMNDGTITSCSNRGTVTGSGSDVYVGGICGNNKGTVTSCSNSGSVTGSGDVGGICGHNYSSKSGEICITSCSNSGSVSGSGDVGGICGYNSSFKFGEPCITSCNNRGAVTGSGDVGGICGLNEGSTITSCCNSGSVTDSGAGESFVGGICGTISSNGSIKNCSNIGSNNSGNVTDSGDVGGICGLNKGSTITSCSNTGSVAGSGICGLNDDGSITSCYWLQDTANNGIGGGSGEATEKTVEQYASGEVAWLLNQGLGNNTWRQNLTDDDKDAVPTLDQTHNIVEYRDNEYTNDGHVYENGFCTCGSYEPATPDEAGTYQIKNAGQLYWFAGLVNGTLTDGTPQNTAANAVLTEDIVLNEKVLKDNGDLNGDGSSFTQWTPIGNEYINHYTGTFDGKGHTISGLYINNSTAQYVGLFGCMITNGSVQNLTLADSYFNNSSYSGGLAYVGGICGGNDGGSITSCINSGTVTGHGYVGGICGYNYSGTITSCSNSGSVSGSGNVGGICGQNYGSITNCYWLQDTANNGIGGGSGEATEKTVEQYASGEVAWLLNQNQADAPWRQNLSEHDKDAAPTLDSTHKVVVQVTFNANTGNEEDNSYQYANSGDTVSVPEAPDYPGHTFGGWYEDENCTGETVTTITATDADNQVYWAKWTAKSYPSTPVTPEPSEPADSEETVTNADGSTTTTITKEDGSISTTTVASDGKVEAEVTLSDEAITQSTESGDNAVALPVPEMTVSSDRDTAPTVTVHLPENTTTSKVDIPVENVTAGTVAILVHEDGSEEVLKNTVQTESGISVAVSDGDTLKIVDNSKTFDDVADDHWGAAAIDFATSRELFAGTAENTFSPDSAMTRAMIWSVLARYEGADTTAAEGSAWYAGTQQWAIDNGISDGTNPNDPMTREQFAAMLYRSVGSPAVNGSVGDFGDAASVSSWASDAMIWAVQNGIIGGYEDSTLRPQNTATRTEVAAMLQRYVILNAQ